ncbi:C_GCAxxG_C_C family protein [Candidatus Thorarchaeota archaeon]|nr:MAG: C_GCAxxG_C_C family protein [Candidatus Thorarchaeota archaeon]
MARAMEEINGLKLNCAESVLLKVNREKELPGFDAAIMRIASALGGGVCGRGELCGAVTGGVICLALVKGTTGMESPSSFEIRRKKLRDTVRKYLDDFYDSWGSVRCDELRAMDAGELPPSGKERKNHPPNTSNCDKYVSWVADHLSSHLKNTKAEE